MKRRVLRSALAVAMCASILGSVPDLPATAGGSEVLAFGEAVPFAGEVSARAVAAVASPSRRGLIIASSTGEVRTYGDATNAGSVSGQLNAPVLDIERTPTGRGYWLVGRDGGVFTFGDAWFFGSTGAMRLNAPIVAGAATPTGRGYWLIARDGGVFTFGDARFFGSTGAMHLNAPIVAAMGTPTGGGYWLIARDGGVFTFGDAAFHGSAGSIPLNEPILDATATPTGRGYWMVARDGGVFTFGDAGYHGSAVGRIPPASTATAIVGADRGYWVVATPQPPTIALAGDVHGERQIGEQLRRGENPLDHVAGALRAADAAAVNLETPAGRAGQAQPKQYVFQAPPELLGALAAVGVDVVSLANNHALDHGAGSMLDTIDRARAAGLQVVGAGANAAEAYRPAYVDAPSARIGFVGLSRVVPPGWAATASRAGVASAYDERAAVGAVREAAAHADVVVVLIHWGVELARCPAGDIVGLADRLHGAGANVVAGHHPHVLQGVDARPNRVTAYSLGNFVWYHNSPPSDVTGVLEAGVHRDGSVATAFLPATIGADGRPRFLDRERADDVRSKVLGSSCWR